MKIDQEKVNKLLSSPKATSDEMMDKKKAVEEDRIARQYEELALRQANQTKYQPFSLANRAPIDLDAASREHVDSLSQKLPFITPELSAVIPVTKGSKFLIGAISGTGKTTMGAAMAYQVLKHAPDTRVLYISNEERADNFFFRLACLDLNLDFNDFRYGRFTDAQRHAMVIAGNRYQNRVVVEKSAKNSSVNGVMEILNSPGVENMSLVVLDYYQGIHRMNEMDNPAAADQERSRILDIFKQKVTDIDIKFPLVILTQLKPLPSTEEERSIETRIKWGTSIYEACDWVFEAINHKSMSAMTLVVQKARFGQAFQSYHCRYDRGGYISLTGSEFDEHVMQKKVASISNIAAVIEDQ